jgi:hypothetical protein
MVPRSVDQREQLRVVCAQIAAGTVDVVAAHLSLPNLSARRSLGLKMRPVTFLALGRT